MSLLLIKTSIADILIVEKLINNYMKENNIKDPNKVDVNIIQHRYDEIMKKQMWENFSNL